ncbi:unnamed protein product [Rhodiola kirilowii]
MSSWSTSVKKRSVGAALGFLLIIAIWTTFDSDLSLGGGLHASTNSSDDDGDGEHCDSPAIFNFGDSNSDTGGYTAAFGRLPPPNGETFFRRSSGRNSDGRLIIDFIAERLKVPYLSAYLDSFLPNFRHGMNFAQSGATILPQDGKVFHVGLNPFSLDLQILQFEDFKARVMELYDEGKSSSMEGHLPSPDDFSNAFYIIDIGQNDLSYAAYIEDDNFKVSISNIINHFVTNIERLYKLGARSFWIHNTGPFGCLPYFIIKGNHSDPGDFDDVGCLRKHNEIAQAFNSKLKNRIILLKSQLRDAALTYVDLYTAKYKLISTANSQGFVDPFDFCCKHHDGNPAGCWERRSVNGTEINPWSCSNPLEHISWDSIHYTEAANKWVSDLILNGSLSDPQVSISQACRRTSC